MSKIDPNKPERFNDTERNLILNRALDSIERIVNGHDPEIHCPLGDEVWNRLDEMAQKIEAKVRGGYEWNHDMSEAPRGHTKGEMLIFTDGEHVGEGYFSLSHQVPYWARGGHRAEPIAWKRITTPTLPCETCKGDAEVCANVPSLRHCEKANRETPEAVADEWNHDTVDKAEAWDAVAAARKDEKQKRSTIETELIEALKGVLTECAPEDPENWGQDAIDAWSNAEQLIQKAEGK